MYDSFSNLTKLFVNFFPYITSFILFYLNYHKDLQLSKNIVLKKRLDNLYFPFYQKYTLGMYSELKLSESNIEIRSSFLDLCSRNLNMMENNSQKLFIEFYKNFMDLLEAYDNNPNYPFEQTAQQFDNSFAKLSKSLMTEYSQICHKLKMPAPIKYF